MEEEEDSEIIELDLIIIIIIISIKDIIHQDNSDLEEAVEEDLDPEELDINQKKLFWIDLI